MPRTVLSPAVALVALTLGAGCTAYPGLNIFSPGGALASAEDNAAYRQRHGAVEVIVKSQHQQILTDIAAGGGPVLTAAFDAAGVAQQDRAARTLQLEGDRGLYETNPGALITSLMLYAG